MMNDELGELIPDSSFIIHRSSFLNGALENHIKRVVPDGVKQGAIRHRFIGVVGVKIFDPVTFIRGVTGQAVHPD
jgi:hypothetical protein